MAITRLNNNSITSVTALPSGIDVGKIGQVVHYKITDTSTITSGSYVDATGFTTLNITPSSTSSKIYINASINVSFDNHSTGQFYLRLRLLRGATEIEEYVPTSNYGTAIGINTAFNTLDSPNTTSQVTYKFQVLRAGSGGTSAKLNSGYAATPFASYVTLMEVLA